MELADYLRILRRWALLLVIPIAAAVLMAGLSFAFQPSFRAQATVAVPHGDRSPAQVSQTVRDYVTMATAAPVLERVSKATGVETQRLAEDLTLKRMGESSFIDIGFVSQDSAEPPRVVRATARATASFLFQRQLREARIPRADLSYEQVRKRGLKAASSSSSLAALSPSERFESQQRVVRALRIDRTEARARGQQSLARDYADALAKQRKQLRELGALVIASKIPHVTEADKEAATLSRAPDVARRTAAATGAGLVVAVGLAVGLEMLFPSRRWQG